MTNPSLVRAVAAVILVMAVPVAVAWVVGDLSTTDDPRPDYVIRPPDIPAALSLTVGGVSVAVVVGCAAVIGWSWRQDPPRSGFLSVLVPLVAVGVLLGLAWRVMTAGVIGANIGAGLMMLFLPPVLLVLIAFAAVAAWRRR